MAAVASPAWLSGVSDPVEYGVCDEPVVEVPAGLVGQAVELLGLCDELLKHPGHNLIDAQVRTVIDRYRCRRPAVDIMRWFYDGLGTTAGDLQDLLDGAGIVVDPTLRGRPAHHRYC